MNGGYGYRQLNLKFDGWKSMIDAQVGLEMLNWEHTRHVLIA